MAGNIVCFTGGCYESVVGQCSGYKGSCGRFYCHTHALGKLCAECGQRKAREAEQTYQAYITAAQGIKEPGWSIALAPLFFIFGIIASGARDFKTGEDAQGLTVFFFVVAGALAIYAIIKYRNAKTTVKALDKAKPGFAEFYRKWKKAKENYIVGEVLGTVGAGLVGAAKGAGESIKIMTEEDRKFREGTPRDVESAIRDLGKKLDK